jgi:FkbM family methyltransferase
MLDRAAESGPTVSMTDFLKHLLVRTPLEVPAHWIRGLQALWGARRQPQLRDVYLESSRIHGLLRRTLREDSNCIDVGCHLGSMLSVIVRLSPGGQHMAFEPIPHKARWLQRKFPEVDVRNCALGEERGEVEFFQNVKHSGFSGLRPHEWGDGEVRRLRIECQRLDDEVPAGRRIDFVKIDVEGAELGVFRGAQRLLREQRPLLVFECSASALDGFEWGVGEVFDCLTDCGYGIYLAKDALDDGEPLTREAFEQAQVFPFRAFNFVAIGR